jgi:hypothetical protein
MSKSKQEQAMGEVKGNTEPEESRELEQRLNRLRNLYLVFSDHIGEIEGALDRTGVSRETESSMPDSETPSDYLARFDDLLENLYALAERAAECRSCLNRLV